MVLPNGGASNRNMIIKKLLRNRGLGVNLIAGLCFILLMVFGWGLSWVQLTNYIVIFLVVIAVVISLAAIAGWLLRKFLNKRD
jgi:hypothetical protein